MHKTIGMAELRRQLQAVLDDVANQHAPYVLAEAGHPKGAIVPYEDFLRFQQLEDQRALEQFERLIARMAEQNADVSDEEIVADVKAALAEVRAGEHQPCRRARVSMRRRRGGRRRASGRRRPAR